jgi:hypothetical protein
LISQEYCKKDLFHKIVNQTSPYGNAPLIAQAIVEKFFGQD